MKAITLLEIAGIAVLVGGGFLLLSSLPEIMRYLKIKRM
jgi:hypothetical protein